MRNIDFILALTLISLSIAEKYDLLTIDLEINPYKTYRIKEKSDNPLYLTFSHTHLGLLLRKSYNLFLKALKENGFKCKNINLLQVFMFHLNVTKIMEIFLL